MLPKGYESTEDNSWKYNTLKAADWKFIKFNIEYMYKDLKIRGTIYIYSITAFSICNITRFFKFKRRGRRWNKG